MSSTSSTTQQTTRHGTLGVIIAVGLALRLFYFVGVSGHDDVNYFNYALDVMDGSFSIEAESDGSFPFRFRVGTIYPTALMFTVFGKSEYVAAVLPLLNSLGLIVLCWWGGRMISESTGTLAALLMATFPMAIVQATILLPGPFAAFFSGVAVLLWLQTERMEQTHETSAAKLRLRYFAAGLSLGLGYFFRIEVGLFVLFFLSFAVVQRRAWLGCLLALVGAAIPVVVENLVYWNLFDEFLYRLQVISGGFAETESDLSEVIQSHKSFTVYLKLMFLKPTDLGLHWAALFPATIYCLFKRRPERTAFLLWFWPVALYLFFGSWSISSYVPTTKEPRYLMNITVPGLILLAALVQNWRVSGRIPRLLSNTGIVSVVLGSLILTNVLYAYRRENASGCRVAANYISNADASLYDISGPIWGEHHTAIALQCLLPEYDVRAVSKHDLSVGLNRIDVQLEEITSGLVVVDEFLMNKYIDYVNMQPPDYLASPPQDWTPALELPHPTDGLAYRVVRIICQITDGMLNGPERSLRCGPVTVYKVAP